MTVPVTGLPGAKELSDSVVQLQGNQLVVWALLVVIVIMASERFLAAWGMRQERKDMVAERALWMSLGDKFGEAAKELGEQTDKLVVELQVLRHLASRVESKTDGQP